MLAKSPPILYLIALVASLSCLGAMASDERGERDSLEVAPLPHWQLRPTSTSGQLLVAISANKQPWRFMVFGRAISRASGCPAGYACGAAMPATVQAAQEGARVSARSIMTGVFKVQQYGWQKGAWVYVAGQEGEEGRWARREALARWSTCGVSLGGVWRNGPSTCQLLKPARAC